MYCIKFPPTSNVYCLNHVFAGIETVWILTNNKIEIGSLPCRLPLGWRNATSHPPWGIRFHRRGTSNSCWRRPLVATDPFRPAAIRLPCYSPQQLALLDPFGRRKSRSRTTILCWPMHDNPRRLICACPWPPRWR